MKTVLITGAMGFVGSHLLEHILLNTDWNIVTIDRLGETTYNGFDRLSYDDSRVKSFTYDLSKPIGKGLRKELGDIQIIFNVASASHVDNSIADPRGFMINNVELQITMLEFARTLPNLERFYQFSTDEVFGSILEGDFLEGDRHNTGNVYSASKSAQEMLCRAYANTYGLKICMSNCMNIIGEKQHPEKFLPKVMSKVLKGETINIHASADGKYIGKRHYIHARNVADAVLFICQNTNEFLDPIDASKGVYNITGEAELDNLEMAQLIAKNMGMDLKYNIVSMDSERPGADLRYGLDGTKLANLGWRPKVDIYTNIKKIIDWTLKTEERKQKWLTI